MKKITVITTLFMLGLAGGLYAQGANDDVEATVDVVAAATIQTITDVDFGEILATPVGTPTMDPAGAGTESNVTGTQTYGKLEIIGYVGASVQVSVDKDSTSLLTSTGGNAIRWNPDFAVDLDDTHGGATGITLTNASPYTMDMSADATQYIWVGGTLAQPDNSALSAQTAGTYSTTNAANGTITVSVVYN